AETEQDTGKVSLTHGLELILESRPSDDVSGIFRQAASPGAAWSRGSSPGSYPGGHWFKSNRRKSFAIRSAECVMKFPEHVALSFLIAQFGVQEEYGAVGTVLVLVAGNLPDIDTLTLLGGWRFYRTYHRIVGHGLPVTIGGPP